MASPCLPCSKSVLHNNVLVVQNVWWNTRQAWNIHNTTLPLFPSLLVSVFQKKCMCYSDCSAVCLWTGETKKKKLLMVKPQRGVNTTYLPTLFLLRSQCLHAEYKYYIYKYILYTPRVHARIKYISYVMHQLMSVVFFFLSFFSSSSCHANLLLLLFAPINVALESIPQHRCLKKKKN